MTTKRTLGPAQRKHLSEVMKLKWQNPVYRSKRAVWLARRRLKKARNAIPDEAYASAEADVIAVEAKAGEQPPDVRKELTEALAVLRSPSDQRSKLSAARLLLEQTRAKPLEA